MPDLDRITAADTYVVDPGREAADRTAMPYALFVLSLPLIAWAAVGVWALVEWIR